MHQGVCVAPRGADRGVSEDVAYHVQQHMREPRAQHRHDGHCARAQRLGVAGARRDRVGADVLGVERERLAAAAVREQRDPDRRARAPAAVGAEQAESGEGGDEFGGGGELEGEAGVEVRGCQSSRTRRH